MITILQILALVVVITQTFRLIKIITASNEYFVISKWQYALDVISITIWAGIAIAWIGLAQS